MKNEKISCFSFEAKSFYVKKFWNPIGSKDQHCHQPSLLHQKMKFSIYDFLVNVTE